MNRFLLTLLLLPLVAFAQTSERQYLSGHDRDDAVPWRFFCTSGPQSGYWTNLPVPSNWEFHGFGTPTYREDLTNSEQGRYECDFTVPAKWAAQRIFLVFDGVMTDAQVAVNDQSAGPEHQGAYYRFRYEITPQLNFTATNRLSVLVRKESANAAVNGAERRGDYWNFGGIFRPVYLEAVPPQFIDRVAIDARADGKFSMDVFTDGANPVDNIEAQISDLAGHLVGSPFSGTISDGTAELHLQVAAPRQWTAETPNLYNVEVRLVRAGKTIHQVTQRFGFRTMEVRSGDGLYVNGQRVILKGANRHSFWPDSGRCLSEAVHRLDINTMKDMNMNAVRMSHYPPDAQFLDLCDELGLYVLDELAGWHQRYDTPTGRQLVEAMVTRDVNHPCILFWDNGNEGGWNPALDADFSRWDPQQRCVLHPRNTFSGLNTKHYPDYPTLETLCAADTIYMPTEFLHGLYDGGAGAGLEDYWNVMSRSRAIGGGFIWGLVDEGIRHPATKQMDVQGNQAPDGILGPYRQKEGSFYTIKELWSPLVITNRTLPDPFHGKLTVENHYSFTDANQCQFSWELWKFPDPGAASGSHTVVASRRLASPAIPPGGSGELALDLPASAAAADALALRAVDPSGRELWQWVWPLSGIDHFRKPIAQAGTQKAVARETAQAIEIQAGDLTVQISRETGMLAGARRGPQSFSLARGPWPAVGSATLIGLVTKTDGADVLVNATFTGDLKSVAWRVRGNGWVQCDYNYTATGPQSYCGVTFDYPETLVQSKQWLGAGPYRVWKNRQRGQTLGLWENNDNNTVTGWKEWIYPEFKGCFADVRWLELKTKEGSITAVPGQPTFVQILTPEFPTEALQKGTVVSLPQAGLAFLDAIPAIGSKFRRAGVSGPQGQPTAAMGDYSGRIDFYFGDVPAGKP